MKNLLIIVFTLCAFSVFGQTNLNSIERKGFVIGLGIGGGVASFSDSSEEVQFEKPAVSISSSNLKIGFMLNERMALLANLPGMTYDLEGKGRSFQSLIPTLQYWVKDRLWVNGGVGLGMDIPAFSEMKDSQEEDWHFGCAVTAETGYEIIQKGNFAIDLQAKVHLGSVFQGNGQHRDGVAFAVGIGVNWY